ncbi:MAG: arginase [Gemmatimonadota bacterium]|jgi:arginase|nr:arginase [Gemmatimonadota bacterium]
MDIEIIGAPIDFGAGRRGVEMGAAAIRIAGLVEKLAALGHSVTDVGDVDVPVRGHAVIGDPRLRYLDEILVVHRALAEAVAGTHSRGRFPLVLGGDHSVGLASIAATSRTHRVGVIWIDTHGDFNTHQTTLTGNVHGMPLAALAGLGFPRLVSMDGWRAPERAVDPAGIVIVGARDIDPKEADLLKTAGVTVLSMAVIDRYGIGRVMEHAIHIAGTDTDGIYASFDLDVMDPSIAPGVGTPSAGGLTVREGHLAMELLSASGRLLGLDVVEVNPVLDERNTTAELAVSLTLSALGKRVWSRETIPELEH